MSEAGDRSIKSNSNVFNLIKSALKGGRPSSQAGDSAEQEHCSLKQRDQTLEVGHHDHHDPDDHDPNDDDDDCDCDDDGGDNAEQEH